MPPRKVYAIELHRTIEQSVVIHVAAETKKEARNAAAQLAEDRQKMRRAEWEDGPEEEPDVHLVEQAEDEDPQYVFDGTDVCDVDDFDDWQNQDLSDEEDEDEDEDEDDRNDDTEAL